MSCPLLQLQYEYSYPGPCNRNKVPARIGVASGGLPPLGRVALCMHEYE